MVKTKQTVEQSSSGNNSLIYEQQPACFGDKGSGIIHLNQTFSNYKACNGRSNTAQMIWKPLPCGQRCRMELQMPVETRTLRSTSKTLSPTWTAQTSSFQTCQIYLHFKSCNYNLIGRFICCYYFCSRFKILPSCFLLIWL